VHVVESVVPNYDEELGVLEPETLNANLEALAASRKSGVEVAAIVRRGDPAAEIMKLAKKKKADLLVVGTHGRTGLQHLLMGSVAEAIVRGATCPVLTIKNTAAFESPAIERTETEQTDSSTQAERTSHGKPN
ncbi:MAG: universal stress protein, partial [Planctomycetales bacterium]|nr:universal stress protein [Planctomycetales bacterium]